MASKEVHSIRVDETTYKLIEAIQDKESYYTIGGIVRLAIEGLAKKKKVEIGAKDGDN